MKGKKGQMHLLVNETRPLHALVRDMVDACKGESAAVAEFLISAIHNELQARG